MTGFHLVSAAPMQCVHTNILFVQENTDFYTSINHSRWVFFYGIRSLDICQLEGEEDKLICPNI